MSSLLCPLLIGREAELEPLTTALDEAARGKGSMLVLLGDPGVGKSRLASEIASLASARGFTVLTGRAVESAAPVPYRAITEALMKIARQGDVPDAPELADYRPALASLVPGWGRPEDREAEISPLILGEALLRLLTASGQAGAVLLLDDLHWADPETLAIVDYVAENIEDRPVLCLAALRDSEPSAGLDVVQGLHARRAATLIKVPRLDDRAIEQMAAACLDTSDVPAAMTRRLLADSDGLPFAVEEILAAAAASGELVQADGGWEVDENVVTGVPASIAGSVLDRLATLGASRASIIVSAAVLGRQFDWTLLPVISGATRHEVLATLQQAHELQLTEPVSAEGIFRFRHSLTRDAILSGLLAPELADRSASAAAAVEAANPGLPDGWCELAARLHEAAGHQERAAELLLEAARRALQRGALHSAAEILSDARALLIAAPSADPALVNNLDEELVKTLALAGDYDKLAPVAEKMAARLDSRGPEARLKARILLMAARTASERNPEAAAMHLSAARAIAEAVQNPITTAWVDAIAARCALDAADLDKADELAHRSLASAEAAGVNAWAADVAYDALEVIGRRERLRDFDAARAAFERAYQISDEQDFAIRRIRAMHELGTIEMLIDGSTSRLAEASELAREAGAISTAMIIDLQLAKVWNVGTDLDRAIAVARQCEAAARRLKLPRLEALALAEQAFAHGVRPDREAMERAAAEAERLQPGDEEVCFATWAQARVVASLFEDDISRAMRESRTGMAYAEQMPLVVPRRGRALNALLRAVTSDSERDTTALSVAAGAVGWNMGCVAYAEAVLAGRDGDRQRATALAAEARDYFLPFAPWWNYLARRLVAPAALRDGWGEPVAWLQEATREFEASGHQKLATACRGILRQAGQRVPRAGRGKAKVPPQMRRLGITSREMDVLLLVARGFSNAEIAERLFISPKTVETHIASLVLKTGQSGRRELVAHAAQFVPS